jgi:hypothetical protein
MTNRLPALIAIVMAVVLLGAGSIMVWQGLDAKNEVRNALVAEAITTPNDASIPDVPVDSAATALAQAEIIQLHTLERTEGLTWAQMDREDPLRPFYLQAVTLRTSLMSAYMAFKLADLVIGLGALFMFVGLAGGAASALTLRSTATVATAARETERAAASV